MSKLDTITIQKLYDRCDALLHYLYALTDSDAAKRRAQIDAGRIPGTAIYLQGRLAELVRGVEDCHYDADKAGLDLQVTFFIWKMSELLDSPEKLFTRKNADSPITRVEIVIDCLERAAKLLYLQLKGADDGAAAGDSSPKLGDGETPFDLKAFIPATQILANYVPAEAGITNYKQLKAYLDVHRNIRTHKPGQQRFSVHIGDWIAHWNSCGAASDGWDNPSPDEMERRMAKVRQSKAGK